MPESPPLNLLDAFVEGATLKSCGESVRVHVHLAGTLAVKSGRILGTDPFKPAEPVPYVRSVPSGHHPVLISVLEYFDRVSDFPCVCMAMLRLRDAQVVSWEVARREGQEGWQLRSARSCGYPMKSAYGAFLAVEGFEWLEGVGAALQAAFHEDDDETWHSAELPLGSGGLNVVAFRAGHGHEPFASWWGLDATGEPVCLVTDFRLLDGVRPRMTGHASARRERIRALTAQARSGEEAVRLEALKELEGYRGEAAEAVETLLAIAAGCEGKEVFESSLMYGARSALGEICAEAPEQVARVARAIAGASSRSAAGLLHAASAIHGPHARPLIPALVDYLRPGHTEDARELALEIIRDNAAVALETLPQVLAQLPGTEKFLRYISILAVAELIGAGAKLDLGEALAVVGPIRTDEEDEWKIQEAQLALLARLPQVPEVTARLVALLHAKDSNIPFWTAEWLLKSGSQVSSAVDALLALATEGDEGKRSVAIYHLARFHAVDARVEPTLRRLAESGPERLRDWTRKRLKHLVH